MRIAYFNSLSADRASAAVAECATIPRWVAAIVAERPFSSVERLLEFAGNAALCWSATDVAAGLAHHPRIGDVPTGDDTGAEQSRREQASITGGDADIDERIRRGNVAYEERFGQVFLIRAAGRSAREILAQLEQRLENDPGAEEHIVARELREIALLRLERMFT